MQIIFAQVATIRTGTRHVNLMKKEAAEKIEQGPKAPAHEQVYQQLRSQILFGDMAPGQPVTIQGLTESLGAGMTPVREAIRRLISDGALVFQGNRRVSVPTLTVADVKELIYVRKSIESHLAGEAAKRATAVDIEDLKRIDTQLDDAITAGDVAGYLRNNYLFHARLYAIADAPIMTGLTDRLWLQFGPSLRVVCGRFGTQNLPDLHKDILDGMRRQDASAVAEATSLDVEQGMLQVIEVLSLPDHGDGFD